MAATLLNKVLVLLCTVPVLCSGCDRKSEPQVEQPSLVSCIEETVRTPLTRTETIEWNKLQLPSQPQDSGVTNSCLSGAFAGMIGDELVIAGGSDGKDGYTANVCSYSEEEGWRFYEDVLPQASAYGCSIELTDGILCIGGCNEDGAVSDVFLLGRNKDGIPGITPWPSLPEPLSDMAGVRMGSRIFIVGGITSARNNGSTKTFLCLDTESKDKGWQQQKAWDGEDRVNAAVTVQSDGLDNCLYIFGGQKVKGDCAMETLTDAWKYNPRLDKWFALDGNFPVGASGCISFGTNHILFLADPMILYHTVTGSSIAADPGFGMPSSTAIAHKGKDFYICGGEVSPGIQTPDIIKGTMTSHIRPMGWLDIAVIILYFLVLAWMGWYFSKRQKNADDYFKGGGRIPWFIVGLSIFGTALSAITFMSIPAKAYATDWSYLLFNAGIVLVVPIIVLIFIPFFRKLGVTTAYEYLEKRYSPLVRVICSISFICYQVGRMGVVLLLPAIALNIVTGFNIFLCVALMGIFALIYTYMGGIEAVAWTDALQVVVLIGAAVTVVCFICEATPGGMGGVIGTAAADSKFSLGSLRFDLKQATIWTTLIATCFTNLTTYGTDQTIVQRYLTTSTEKEARKGVYTNALLCIPATLLFFFVGTCLYVFFKNNPTQLSAAVANPDAILPWYVSLHIPAGLMGLVIAGIFAAAMSTLSASMNSAATAYITDIFSKTKRSNNADVLKAAKRATVVIGIIGVGFALMMATWDIKSLWDEFSKILGILLGGLGGLFLLGFTSRKANATGALCGLAGCIAVQLTVMHFQSVNLLLYSSVGFISCYVIGWVASILSGGPKKDINELTIRR